MCLHECLEQFNLAGAQASVVVVPLTVLVFCRPGVS
jgi:hypothetical protein